MSQQSIDGLLLKEMIIAGANLLEQNREAIDALNVFPVPDGDTGTNMSLTMKSTVKEIAAVDEHSASKLLSMAARGALKGARGNSGVILSQILRGFARGIDGAETIDAETFAKGLESGAKTAYKAVMKPKEGTILTVIRVIAEDSARYVVKHPGDLPKLLDKVIRSGEAILEKTPDMLPALKQAGVVDSGGQGLLTVLKGWRAAFNGEKIEDTTANIGSAATFEFEDDHESMEEVKFKYCTEFIIQYMNPGVTEDDINKFRTRLTRIGDCVVVVGDFSLVKVHVHTNDPGKAIQYACELGELVNLKIDNMAEERRERLKKAEADQKAAAEKQQQEEAAKAGAAQGIRHGGRVAGRGLLRHLRRSGRGSHRRGRPDHEPQHRGYSRRGGKSTARRTSLFCRITLTSFSPRLRRPSFPSGTSSFCRRRTSRWASARSSRSTRRRVWRKTARP